MISEELKEIYASAPVDRYYVETLSLEHPTFEDGVRYLTNHFGGWIGTIESGFDVLYEHIPFATVPPTNAENAAISLNIVIDNTSRELMLELENMAQTPSQPITVMYRVYTNTDPKVVQNDPPLRLWVQTVIATQNSVSFSASTTNLRDTPFPGIVYTTDYFPGLDR